MKHLAITGNIGSGKSTVCKIFEVLGIPVYYSDARAKELMIKDADLILAIKSLLGNESYNDNQLDRNYVSSKIFSDNNLLQEMNNLVHPAVRKDYMKWRKEQIAPFTLQESALTFEISADKIMDKTLLVYAPEELLIARTMARSNQTRDQVLERLNKQMDQEEKKAKADYIIDNSLGTSLIPQVLNIYRRHQQ